MSNDLFRSKTVVLGVCGSIAAYKAVDLCRELVRRGAYVIPVVTKAAGHFVDARTFSALASEDAKTDLFDDSLVTPHIALAKSADLVIVAPATARLIGEYAQAISRDLLVSTLLATKAPVLLAPAMHTEMWEHPLLQANVRRLEGSGVIFVGPETGRLAGGDVGKGRFSDSEKILDMAGKILAGVSQKVASEASLSEVESNDLLTVISTPNMQSCLSGKEILVTAGGTKEPIDEVRYIGNRSSGKQGISLAMAASTRGAKVTLVLPEYALRSALVTFALTFTQNAASANCDGLLTGGGLLNPIRVIFIQTAAEMAKVVFSRFGTCDVLIMAAAVADFRPKDPYRGKYKKEDGLLSFEFEQTEDIVAACTDRRRDGQYVVGFAAESGESDLLLLGKKKLLSKQLDMIVVNDISREDIGFDADCNEVFIYEKSGISLAVDRLSKPKIAEKILDFLEQFLPQ